MTCKNCKDMEEGKCCEDYNGTLDITNSCIFCKTYYPKEHTPLEDKYCYACDALFKGIGFDECPECEEPFEEPMKTKCEKEPYNYARDGSHVHCWNQKQPSACGIPLEKHSQCCLCDMKSPKDNYTECEKCGLLKSTIEQFDPTECNHIFNKEEEKYKEVCGGELYDNISKSKCLAYKPCPIHSPPPQSWEERFDRLFAPFYASEAFEVRGIKFTVNFSAIKDFIKEELSHSRQEVLEELKGEIGKLERKEDDEHELSPTEADGYNLCIDHILSLINKKQGK